MLPAPVGPLLDPGSTNLEALEADIEEKVEAAAAAAAADSPRGSLPSALEDEIQEVIEEEENPSLLPAYQSTPLFAPHELRNELDYDEATGAIAEGPKEERPGTCVSLSLSTAWAAASSHPLSSPDYLKLAHPFPHKCPRWSSSSICSLRRCWRSSATRWPSIGMSSQARSCSTTSSSSN